MSLEEIITKAHCPIPDNQHKAEVEPQHLEGLRSCQMEKIQPFPPFCISSSEHRNHKARWTAECSGRNSFSLRSFYCTMFEKFKAPLSFYIRSPGSAPLVDSFKNHFGNPFWGARFNKLTIRAYREGKYFNSTLGKGLGSYLKRHLPQM